MLVVVDDNSNKGKGKVKGKVLPKTAHEDPERNKSYSCTLPSTSGDNINNNNNNNNTCRFHPINGHESLDG